MPTLTAWGVSDKLCHNFYNLIKDKKISKQDAVAYACAKLVLLQDEITKEKFDRMKIQMENFYEKSAAANKKIAQEMV